MLQNVYLNHKVVRGSGGAVDAGGVVIVTVIVRADTEHWKCENIYAVGKG